MAGQQVEGQQAHGPGKPVEPAEQAPRARELASTEAGRVALSVFLIVVLAAIFVTNLPDNPLRQAALPLTQPVTDTLALHQSWALFAPQPRRSTLGLRAEIEYADGQVVHWQPPEGGRLVGVYRDYRWRKHWEHLANPERSGLHERLARYLAREHARPGEGPVAVRIFRLSYLPPEAGSGERPAVDPVWEETLVYEATAAPGPEADR